METETQSINCEQWQSFLEDGYFIAKGLIDSTTLKSLQNRLDDIMMGKARVDYGRMLMQLDSETGDYSDAGEQSKGFKGATLNYRKIQDLEFDPMFLELMRHPLFESTCRQVYGNEADIAVFRAMFMNKPANRGTFLPWHQDRWTFLDRDPQLTIWCALDPATKENGCVQIVPASHRNGLINPSHPSGFLTDEQAAEYATAENIVYVELEPGDVVFLHNYLLHASDVNRSSQSRRAFSICYMDKASVDSREKPHDYPVIFGEGAL
ncbi:phytanoyl-CoA dioxygenase family protein [Rubellicoccus peritrichatus]|uniref:Phytanoyl-CoA dioxygenase family protein n=1 Tax=Rubellicoccus peritrichatus TaxID=3080537 RepID=A0AAQ3LES7_9BACT|nr:phytanoyl-CoA dioxygenase family protein [Puniceicoccus sp. CR14]WOO40594.1 phytanoyl-CoA dioxygenase family protein [Puniceicoccus sp. CR14]